MHRLSLLPAMEDSRCTLPERVLQIGTGNFLRAFSAWMIDRMNRGRLFGGRIVIAQATSSSRTAAVINQQDGWYTVLSRGLVAGKPAEHIDLVGSVSRAVNPYTQWPEVLTIAANPQLRFIISNTTEAGIVYRSSPPPRDECPATFPAQLAALLYERYRKCGRADDRGWIVLPCELIDRNGDTLKRIVLQHAEEWRLERGFIDWVKGACRFANTLVDRIVPGFPVAEADDLRQRLGYDDRLMVAAEWYHNWIIEGDADLSREWPAAEAGLNITWTDDLTPYHLRKVRILNGAHTLMAAPALLSDLDTVQEAIEDPLVGPLVERALNEEIVPALDLLALDAAGFARQVLERFRNPYIAHRLTSIALNGVSKWRVRVRPSVEAYLERQHDLPKTLCFSLAALLALYRGEDRGDGLLVGRRCRGDYQVREEPDVLAFLTGVWSQYNHVHDLAGTCQSLLGSVRLWGRDLNELPDLTRRVIGHLDVILHAGMVPALKQVLRGDP